MSVIAEIQFVEEPDGRCWIRLCFDGHEIDKWGPFVDRSGAMTLAKKAGDTMRKIEKKQWLLSAGKK